MPPHCDTMDGPVVRAAREALNARNINIILPYLPKSAEHEMKGIFEKTLLVRQSGIEAAELADRWFFENAVRLHRQGEGAPYTGLKPAGLDVGPAIPKAERAIEQGTAGEVTQFLFHELKEKLDEMMRRIVTSKHYDINNVEAAREHVHAVLGFELFTHHLYTSIKSGELRGEEAVPEAGGGEH